MKQINNFFVLLTGIGCIIGGIDICKTNKFTPHYYEPVELGKFGIVIGIAFVIIGLLLLYSITRTYKK